MKQSVTPKKKALVASFAAMTLLASANAAIAQVVDGIPYNLGQDLDAPVRNIVSTCHLEFRRSEVAGEFRLSDYGPEQSWTVGEDTFPRHPSYLYRSITVNPRFEPQFTLNRVARGILGDRSQTVGSWAYDNLRTLFVTPSRGAPTASTASNQCYTAQTANGISATTCFQNPDIVRELRAMDLLDPVVGCVIPQISSMGGLNAAQAQTLTQVVVNRGFINLRNETAPGNNANLPANSPLANLYFRYVGPVRSGQTISAGDRQYAEWTKLNLFASLHPEITTFYGYNTLVFSDPGHRAIDLNAYNHAYYQGSRMSLLHGDHIVTPLNSRFYSCASVDNAEFIMPGYIRAREFEGMDFHAQQDGNWRGSREIQVAYRKISLHTPARGRLDNRGNFAYNPVLVIDAQGATCVTLDAEERPVRCASRPDPMSSPTVASPQPSADPADRLPVLGIIGLCADPNSETCVVPASLESHYGEQSRMAVSDAARQANARQIAQVSSTDPIFYPGSVHGRNSQVALYPVFKPFRGVSHQQAVSSEMETSDGSGGSDSSN